jgi:hypothetical protein
MLSLCRFSHNFGNEYSGKFSYVFNLEVGTKNSWTMEKFSTLLASFLVHTQQNLQILKFDSHLNRTLRLR